MRKAGFMCAAVFILSGFGAGTALADLSAFVGTVGFDDQANLDRSMALGLRWGQSSGFIGGETSLMIARPDRDFSSGLASSETATAFFYEGRIMMNIPVGQWQPFFGVGLGAVTITSTDNDVLDDGGVLTDSGQALAAAMDVVSDLHTSTAVSYGGGVRYHLDQRFSLRLDVRQYVVFDVKGIAVEQAMRQLETQTGVAVQDEKNTVQYNEVTLGINVAF